MWDDEVKWLVQQQNIAYKKYLRTKNIENEIEYKYRRATANGEIIKRHRKVWEQFISQLEPDTYKIRPNTFRLLKHMNKDITESANINPVPSQILPAINSAMSFLTHWGRVRQICVFTLQLCKTDDANLRF